MAADGKGGRDHREWSGRVPGLNCQGRLALAAEKFAAHQEKVVDRTLVSADLLRAVLPQLTVTNTFENLTLQSLAPEDFVLPVAKFSSCASSFSRSLR
jgi:hypothetical protein